MARSICKNESIKDLGACKLLYVMSVLEKLSVLFSGGQMSTDYAANAPEFFMHHGMLDSIWYRWQEKDHKCKYAYFPKNVSKVMDAHPFTTMDFIDSFNQGRCVKVKYDDWIAKKIKPGTKLGM